MTDCHLTALDRSHMAHMGHCNYIENHRNMLRRCYKNFGEPDDNGLCDGVMGVRTSRVPVHLGVGWRPKCLAEPHLIVAATVLVKTEGRHVLGLNLLKYGKLHHADFEESLVTSVMYLSIPLIVS